jgi:hypothetical protein
MYEHIHLLQRPQNSWRVLLRDSSYLRGRAPDISRRFTHLTLIRDATQRTITTVWSGLHIIQRCYTFYGGESLSAARLQLTFPNITHLNERSNAIYSQFSPHNGYTTDQLTQGLGFESQQWEVFFLRSIKTAVQI